ncbi:MAG: virginiamycin B lyase [Oleispira sp.]|jgi:virginiamycin B lyase
MWKKLHHSLGAEIGLPSNGLWRWVSDTFLPSILEVASWFGKKGLHVTLSHHKVTGEGREVLDLPYGIDVSPVEGARGVY